MAGEHKDEGKAKWYLAPWRAFASVVEVLTYGAVKKGYGERNWEQGIKFSKLFASAHRHMLQWWLRNDIDPESGLNHLKHAMCNLAMLVEYIERNMNAFDDRPTTVCSGTADPAQRQADSGRVDKRASIANDNFGIIPACAHRGFRYYNFREKDGRRFGPYCDDCRQLLP